MHKKTCHAIFGLDRAGRLVGNALYVKLTENQVRIRLKRTFIYFPWFFILPSLLKSSQKFTFDGQMAIFIIENIQIHHCICLILNLPFLICFTLSWIFCLSRISTRFTLYAFCHIFIHTYEITRTFEKYIFIVLPPLVFNIDLAKMLPFPTFTNSQFVSP